MTCILDANLNNDIPSLHPTHNFSSTYADYKSEEPSSPPPPSKTQSNTQNEPNPLSLDYEETSSSPNPLNILDLPPEIISEIFHHIHGSQPITITPNFHPGINNTDYNPVAVNVNSIKNDININIKPNEDLSNPKQEMHILVLKTKAHAYTPHLLKIHPLLSPHALLKSFSRPLILNLSVQDSYIFLSKTLSLNQRLALKRVRFLRFLVRWNWDLGRDIWVRGKEVKGMEGFWGAVRREVLGLRVREGEMGGEVTEGEVTYGDGQVKEGEIANVAEEEQEDEDIDEEDEDIDEEKENHGSDGIALDEMSNLDVLIEYLRLRSLNSRLGR